MGLAVTEHARRRRRGQILAGGALACAFVLVAPIARADDSLWGKAMNSIGLGGDGSSGQGAASPQSAAPAQQPAPAAQAEPAAGPGENQNLLANFFGWGHQGAAQPTSQGAVQPQAKAMTPVQTPPAPAPASEPGLWDRMLGNAGLSTGTTTDNISYADRPKLNVPKARSLPQPGPAAEQAGVHPSNPQDLVRPPDGYLEKVRGADGNVSGLKSDDISKDKKFFGLF